MHGPDVEIRTISRALALSLSELPKIEAEVESFTTRVA